MLHVLLILDELLSTYSLHVYSFEMFTNEPAIWSLILEVLYLLNFPYSWNSFEHKTIGRDVLDRNDSISKPPLQFSIKPEHLIINSH